MSTGHVVMIVAGLLATVLTYAVLRQAAGVGPEESVAAADIHAGQVVTPSMFATTNVKAPSLALSGILTPKEAAGMSGPTVYHYYASKSLILYDIYKGAADFTVDALHDDPTASARETIYHFTRRLLVGIAGNIERAAVYFQEGPYITEWFTEDQVGYIRGKETQVYEHVRDLIDRGIASGEFYDCDSHVLALGYIGMTLGSYRWLRPQGRRTAQEIAEEFSTALLRGLIRDEVVREVSPLGVDIAAR